MDVKMISAVVTFLITIGSAGWWAKSTLATKDEVIVADSKGSTALDLQMENLIKQIARLESKPNKTPDELAQLRYWREQLARLRQIRK